MIDENDILGRVIAGDVHAFRAIVERYERPLFRMVRGLLIDSHSSEDVVQETFLAAYRKLDLFDRRRSRFSTWLFTIGKNLALNALARRIPAVVDELPQHIDMNTPDRIVGGKEFCAMLDRMLQRLPQNQRVVFVLAEFSELSYAEIAVIESINVGTVRSRLYKAKQTLRRLLEEGNPE